MDLKRNFAMHHEYLMIADKYKHKHANDIILEFFANFISGIDCIDYKDAEIGDCIHKIKKIVEKSELGDTVKQKVKELDSKQIEYTKDMEILY